MRIITADEINTIILGYQGENNATQVQIPVTGWTELYGTGSFELLNQRPGDPDGYFVFPAVEDEIVKWSPSSSDLAFSGVGRLQLRYIVDGTIAKSVIYPTEILQSLDDSATPPDPWQSWVDDVIRAKDDAESARDAAKDAQNKADGAQEAAETAQGKAEDAETGAENARAAIEAMTAAASVDANVGTPSVDVIKTTEGDPAHVKLTFHFHNLKGETGNGIQSITKTGTSGNVDTYTITFTNGQTAIFTVTNCLTEILVNGVPPASLLFTSDPQTQINTINETGFYVDADGYVCQKLNGEVE